jgi:hypothetical protein
MEKLDHQIFFEQKKLQYLRIVVFGDGVVGLEITSNRNYIVDMYLIWFNLNRTVFILHQITP